MGEERLNELSRALASATTRRQALKIVGATAVGGALSLVGARSASAIAPGRCRRVGVPCRQDVECCDFFCNRATGRCACPPSTFLCGKSKLCVECRPPGVFNPETCQCECPADTTPCDGQCCGAGFKCCPSYYGGGFCVPEDYPYC
jgi:hypothetical protein